MTTTDTFRPDFTAHEQDVRSAMQLLAKTFPAEVAYNEHYDEQEGWVFELTPTDQDAAFIEIFGVAKTAVISFGGLWIEPQDKGDWEANLEHIKAHVLAALNGQATAYVKETELGRQQFMLTLTLGGKPFTYHRNVAIPAIFKRRPQVAKVEFAPWVDLHKYQDLLKQIRSKA